MATAETSQSAAGQPAQVMHPLDPLTPEEISAAIEIIRSHHQLSERARFPTIALHEPPKEAVLTFREGQPIRREAEVSVLDKGTGAIYEAIVSLDDKEARE